MGQLELLDLVMVNSISQFLPWRGLQELPTQQRPFTIHVTMRKYMSKRQRPCDFCRSRKTACRIDVSPPCRSCQLHRKECTFVETPKPRKRPQSPEVSRVQLGASSVAESLAYESVGTDGSPNAHSISQVGIYENASQEPLGEVMEALSSTDMALQFLNDLDLEGSEYHFMFRTPRSPSLAMQHEAPAPAINSRRITLDDPNLRPETLGLSGDMDPFLLQRYRIDDLGNFKFKQLSIQSVQQDPFPVYFLASHPSLFARNRIEAGHQPYPDPESRRNLEAIIPPEMGKRLITLYQKFIAPQYPIFSTEQLPDPALAPPSLLAAIYTTAFSFATYDDQLCIDLAYDSPPFESLSLE